MYTDLNNLCVIEGTSIRDAIARMDVSRVGIVLVVDSERRLLGTITDGDVRRAVLARTEGLHGHANAAELRMKRLIGE